MLQVKFWWSGYSPEQALESFDLAITGMPFEVSRDAGQTWRAPRDGATLRTVHDWMMDEGLSVMHTTLVNQRRRGRWEGQYVLTIGPVH
jgi:hypothetical protein